MRTPIPPFGETRVMEKKRVKTKPPKLEKSQQGKKNKGLKTLITGEMEKRNPMGIPGRTFLPKNQGVI